MNVWKRVLQTLGLAVVTLLLAAPPLQATVAIKGPTKPLKANGAKATLSVLFTNEEGTEKLIAAAVASDPDGIVSGLTGDGTKVKISKGKGKGKVVLTVLKSESSLPRSVTVTINDVSFTVYQAGQPCKVAIAPTKATFTCDEGVGSFNVTAPAGCPWNVAATADWITPGKTGGEGNDTVAYVVAANTGKKRTGKVQVAGIDPVKLTPTAKKTLSITQQLRKPVADLAGTWELNTVGSELDFPGPYASWWSRGTFTIDSDGVFSGELIGSDGSSAAKSITFSIASNGKITAKGSPGSEVPTSFECVMDSGKTVIVCTAGTERSEWTELMLLTRKAAGYNSDDLPGIWEMNSLTAPDQGWSRGTLIVSGGGIFSGTDISWDDPAKPDPVSGSLSFAEDGRITVSIDGVAYAPRCVMDSGKTVIVCTGTTEEGRHDLLVLTKRDTPYILDDVAGPWKITTFGIPGLRWQRGTLTMEDDGSFTSRVKSQDGSSDSVSGILSITSTYEISVTGPDIPPTLRCVLDEDKTVMICTGTLDEGISDMHILVK